MTLQDALERYLVQLEADGRSPHTIGQYRRHITALASWLGAREVGEIGHEDLARFLAETRSDRRATTMNAVRTSLRTFFGYLHEAGTLRQNPARLIRRAICGTPPPRTLSDDDRDRLMKAVAAHPRDHALFHLLLAAGIRIGSALALDIEDVDLDRGELALRRTKGDHPDRVYLNAEIREHLRRHIGERRSGALFLGTTGERIGARHAHRRFAEWLAKAGITRSASPHPLRHTFASNLLRITGDIAIVQAALRHRSITSTLVYAKVDEARVRAAVEM